MRNIPDVCGVALPIPVPGHLTQIARDLALALTYRSWDCTWERCPAPFPQSARVRLTCHLRAGRRTLVIDLMRRSDARMHWPDIRDPAHRMRDEALERGEEYFLMTDRSVTPVLRSNLVRLLRARPHHPTRDVEAVICDDCPSDSVISFGILAARAARAGIDVAVAESAIIWLLARDAFRGDLRQPLGRGFHLRRRLPFGRGIKPPVSPEPRRRAHPPWVLPL